MRFASIVRSSLSKRPEKRISHNLLDEIPLSHLLVRGLQRFEIDLPFPICRCVVRDSLRSDTCRLYDFTCILQDMPDEFLRTFRAGILLHLLFLGPFVLNDESFVSDTAPDLLCSVRRERSHYSLPRLQHSSQNSAPII